MKEKIKDIIEKIRTTIKEQLEKNKALAEKFEKIKSLLEKLNKNKQTTSKTRGKKKAFVRKIKKIFSAGSIATVMGIIISIPAIAFLGYSSYDYVISQKQEKLSTESIVKSNLNFATKQMIKLLSVKKIKKKNLRRIIKKLNGEDDFGRLHKFGPCEGGYVAFGEYPTPGNVVIKKPTRYEFEITAYNCEVEPIVTKTIKLKPPEKKQKTTTGEKDKQPINEHTPSSDKAKDNNKSVHNIGQYKTEEIKHAPETHSNNEHKKDSPSNQH